MNSLLGQEFETIQKARDTITRIIIDTGLSYKKLKSTRICYILICKDNTCITPPFLCQYSILTYTGGFRVHASYLRCLGITRITIYTPHTCSFTTHTYFRYSNAISYTFTHHLDTISQDRNLKPKYITNNERLQYSNQLSYKQAWRLKEKAIQQIEGDQSEQFALLPLLCCYIEEQHEYSITNFELYPDQTFKCLFIAPGALGQSFGENIRHLIAIDATHTTSRKLIP